MGGFLTPKTRRPYHLAFTDEQRAQIRAAAQPIPWAFRKGYLERIAGLLAGRQFSNGDV
jgi:hypothetical protein